MIMDYGGFKTLGGFNKYDNNLIGLYSICSKNKEEKYNQLNNIDQYDIIKMNFKELMD